jgi:hypothetical protein
MGNTITNMEVDAYVALNTVLDSPRGLIGSVAMDAKANAVAKGKSVNSFLTPDPGEPGDFTPSMTDPGAKNEEFGNIAVTLDQMKYLDLSWSGEEEYAVDQTFGHLAPQQQQIAARMDRLLTRAEAWLWGKMYKKASRAYGAAATKPFGTAGNLADVGEMDRILVENGVPEGALRFGVLSPLAAVNLIGLQSQAQMAGDASMQRSGVLLDYAGFKLKRSAGIGRHTAGTNNGAYDVNQLATPPVAGDKTIAFDTGAGTILAGDIIVNAEAGRDPEKYVVGTALNAGSLKLNAGLRTAWNDNDTITGTATYTANLFFARTAAIFATRIPAFPEHGDKATYAFTVTHPRDKISFMLRYYPGTGMGTWRIFFLYGGEVLDSLQIATLIS